MNPKIPSDQHHLHLRYGNVQRAENHCDKGLPADQIRCCPGYLMPEPGKSLHRWGKPII